MHGLVGPIERGQQANDIAVRAVYEELAFQACIDDRRAVDGQLDADHGALDANLLDQRTAFLQGFEASAKRIGDLGGARQQLVFLDRLDGGERGSTGDRVAAERGGVGARHKFLGKFTFRKQPAASDADPMANALR